MRPYPCVGSWGFLDPGIYHLPAYTAVLERVKEGQSLLDIGCGMGQDLRRLAADGAPTDNMYATDIIPDFWDIGYDLFRDREGMKAKFIQADILDPESALMPFAGKMDIMYVGLFLHLFTWSKQVDALKRMVRLSREGSTVLGCQVGHREAREIGTAWGGGGGGGTVVFHHNVESFENMWRQVGRETGTRWAIEAWCQSPEEVARLEKEDVAWLAPGAVILHFVASRQ